MAEKRGIRRALTLRVKTKRNQQLKPHGGCSNLKYNKTAKVSPFCCDCGHCKTVRGVNESIRRKLQRKNRERIKEIL